MDDSYLGSTGNTLITLPSANKRSEFFVFVITVNPYEIWIAGIAARPEETILSVRGISGGFDR